MSLSHEAEHDEQVMTQYFLGQLSAEDAERLDEQSIADAELARRLRVVEHDLVDAYVRGALDTATRAQFERAYLTSTRRREKVRFAESLRRAVDRTTTPTATPTSTATTTPSATPAAAPAPPRTRRAGFSFGWGSLVWAAAAVLLFVTGALLVQATQLRRELTAAESQRAALDRRTQDLQQQLNDQLAAKAETMKELDRLRVLLETAMQNAVSAGGATAEQSLRSGLLTTAALILSPATRSIAASVPTMPMPAANTQGAAFRLVLEANPFSSYQVTLKDPGTNAIIWRSARIAPSSGREGPSVAVVVPARLLKAQHYSLDLSGFGGSGNSELLGSYAFQVIRR